MGLAPSPRLLLLDEPVAGLLHEDVDRMMALVRSLRDVQGITVVLVEHNMQAVMGVCDRITVLQFGSVIAEGAPAAIAADPQGDRGLSRRVRRRCCLRCAAWRWRTAPRAC